MAEMVQKSPDMCPLPFLPDVLPCKHKFYSSYVADSRTPPDNEDSGFLKRKKRSTIDSSHEGDPESPSVGTSSSVFDSEDYAHIRVDSPPPLNETLTNRKDERRYRMLLQHEFHPSCTFHLLNLI